MPDADKFDFSGLADELLGDEDLDETPEETPEDEPEDDVEEPTEKEDLEDKDPEGDEPEEQEPPKEDKPKPASKEDASAKAFAAMRAENAKYQRLLKNQAQAAGLTVEEYMKKAEQDALEKRAEQMNVPKEYLERLEQLEKDRAELQVLRATTHLQNEFATLQKTLNVSDKDLKEFTTELAQRGFNFQDTNVDYALLYKGMNYDKLLEKERQRWIRDANKGNSSGTVSPKRGKTPDYTGETIDSAEELEEILAGFKQ